MLVTPCNIGNNFFELIDPILRWNLVCRIGSKHLNPIQHTPCRSDFRWRRKHLTGLSETFFKNHILYRNQYCNPFYCILGFPLVVWIGLHFQSLSKYNFWPTYWTFCKFPKFPQALKTWQFCHSPCLKVFLQYLEILNPFYVLESFRVLS